MLANRPKKPKKPKVVARRRPRLPNEKATLTLFIGSLERGQNKNWIRIESTERYPFDCVIDRCRKRLAAIEQEAKIKAWEKEYKSEREARIKFGHKTSGYSDWKKRYPGSAYTKEK